MALGVFNWNVDTFKDICFRDFYNVLNNLCRFYYIVMDFSKFYFIHLWIYIGNSLTNNKEIKIMSNKKILNNFLTVS